jgi:DNA-binding transcriptional LysR family regulator
MREAVLRAQRAIVEMAQKTSVSSWSMPSASSAVAELRLADVATYLAVIRTGSVTATARELRVTPSQVSKAVMRLESYVRRPLLTRKSRGVAATEPGRELLPRLQDLLESARGLPEQATGAELLTIAAPSYLATTLIAAIATSLEGSRVRAVEGGEAFFRAYAGDDVFQLALTSSEEPLTHAWSSEKLGTLRQAFFAAPSVAAKTGTTVTRKQLRDLPFVMPIYHRNGQLLPGEDGCPIPRSDRVTGHEVPTAAVAFEIAATTRQIAFGPEIAARAHVRDGRLVELQLEGEVTTVDLYFQVNQDRVLERTRAKVVAIVTDALGAEPAPRGASRSSRRRS